MSYPQQPSYPQGPGYPGQPGYQPPRKDNTARNLLIGFAVLFVLLAGGCVAAVVGAGLVFDRTVDEFSDVFEVEDPAPIEEGEAFTYAGFEAEGGWRIQPAPSGITIEGIRVTNVSAPGDPFTEDSSVLWDVEFRTGNEVVDSVTCSSPRALRQGDAARLTCSSGLSTTTLDSFDNLLVVDRI